ncbi:cation:proton antiporter [Streptomyces sp. enrichment culture]|uniref:cation:proton antiporter n=1 Tax=Streptomyces sp. enrichment culture TaxID=1795815 RepID=UPI003F5751F1
MSPDETVMHILLATALILVIAHAAGWAAQRLKQPYIVGQLTAGIALGPSLLGSVWPGGHDVLFPTEIDTALTGFAQLALVVFLFAVGYELDLKVLGDRARSAVAVAAASFVVPMAVGSGCALLFQDQLRGLGMPELSVAQVVFAGVALSITAVPVLTAIVRENDMSRTVSGVVAVSAAGLLDVLGWTVLAGALLGSDNGEQELNWWWRALLSAGFITLMLLGARPVLRRLLWRTRMEPSLRLALLTSFAVGSAVVTHALGLHVIFGALLAGVVTPREEDGTLDPDLLRALHTVSHLLVPFFFVVSGKAVALGSLDGAGWAVLAVVTVLAVTTKIGSGTAAARLSGLGHRDAWTIGILMSTRGLTELIALNAGYQAGLLSRPLYTVLVFMALATTLLTQPLLLLVHRLTGHPDNALPPPPDRPRPPHTDQDGAPATPAADVG